MALSWFVGGHALAPSRNAPSTPERLDHRYGRERRRFAAQNARTEADRR
jgi:hypothetical protein